jgi:hypothetical protein
VEMFGAGHVTGYYRPFILQNAIRRRPEPYKHQSSPYAPSRRRKEVVVEHDLRLGTRTQRYRLDKNEASTRDRETSLLRPRAGETRRCVDVPSIHVQMAFRLRKDCAHSVITLAAATRETSTNLSHKRALYHCLCGTTG